MLKKGKDAGLFCGSFLRKGEVFAYVGRIQNLEDLKAPKGGVRLSTLEATQGQILGQSPTDAASPR